MPKNSEVRSKSIPEWCGYTRLVSNSVNIFIKSRKVRVNFIRPNADPVFFQVSNPNPDFSNFQIRIRVFFQVSNPDQVFWSSESGSGSSSKFWIRMRLFSSFGSGSTSLVNTKTENPRHHASFYPHCAPREFMKKSGAAGTEPHILFGTASVEP